jgi:hypothetical protein
MAISNAVTLANIPSGDTFTVDGVNDRVGINSTIPTEALTVVGVVSATSFFGDGSNLDGVASAGLGTAISETAPGDVIYYTDTVLSIGATITIDAPSSSNVAYTQYAEIAVEEDKDLIIADGDDFIPDILGLSTEGVTPLVGAGGRIRADNFTNKAGNGAPNFPSGLTGTTGTFSGNVSIAGTLTYEDVTNVDSIGIITARSDISIADKIVHTGDTNTAIRFPAADTFTVETAGTERVRVTSAGRVGFNTNNPGVTIHAEDAQAELQVKSTTGTNSAGFRMIPGGQTNALYMYADGSRNINFDDHATSMISIRAGGGGITFNGDTAAANALDDYEEGTWTPSIGGNATYTNQVGTYVKVGRMVYAHWALTINAQGTGSNISAISGLPYSSGVASQATSNLLWSGFGVSMAYAVYYVGNASTLMNLSYTAGAQTAITNNPNGLVNGATMNGTIVYYSS